MHNKIISFKFEVEQFKVLLDVTPQKEDESLKTDSSLDFIKFLRDLIHISNFEKVIDLPEELALTIYSKNDELLSKKIKEKAKSLNLQVVA